ncbi:MAG TPA: PQQ-binding-like beta-propeller repeat protein [Candidatus Angelobacter sp.]|nr:PQQ-binding-like beta-propeller repeat protein [Candidatus Angelobacter sp.]
MKPRATSRPVVALMVALGIIGGDGASGADWPQLQRDAMRTGRTSDSVAPPYRARWIWCGPSLTLRNRDSQSGWTHDLRAREGYSYPLPATVDFTLANSVQPVVAGGRVFVGSLEGTAYAIDANDGATLWSASLPGGTSVAGAVVGDVVVFVTLSGAIQGLEVTSGESRWTIQARKSITSAPCAVGNSVFVAGQDRHVRAIDARSGKQLWSSAKLGAPIQGGLAADGESVFVGAEDMTVYALRQGDGGIRATNRVHGQSFRLTHPVVHDDFVFFTSGMTPMMGSEYINDPMLADAKDLVDEDEIYARWLAGDSNGGRWPSASVDFQHLFALRTSDLTSPFLIPCGPSEGVGLPPDPPAVDNSGNVLCWWPTKFPKFTKVGAFGMKYSMDICGVNASNGRRVPIDNGRLSNMWPGPESDNLYAMSVGGDYLWLRQAFRGTQNIRLSDTQHHHVSARVRHEDGGNFGADVVYFNRPALQTATPNAVVEEGSGTVVSQSNFEGRTAAVIAGDHVYFAERFCVSALEHEP